MCGRVPCVFLCECACRREIFLHRFAAKKGYLHVVKELLEHGVDANRTYTKQDGARGCAISEACLATHVEVVALLLTHSSAHAIALVGDDEVSQELLQRGRDQEVAAE